MQLSASVLEERRRDFRGGVLSGIAAFAASRCIAFGGRELPRAAARCVSGQIPPRCAVLNHSFLRNWLGFRPWRARPRSTQPQRRGVLLPLRVAVRGLERARRANGAARLVAVRYPQPTVEANEDAKRLLPGRVVPERCWLRWWQLGLRRCCRDQRVQAHPRVSPKIRRTFRGRSPTPGSPLLAATAGWAAV